MIYVPKQLKSLWSSDFAYGFKYTQMTLGLLFGSKLRDQREQERDKDFSFVQMFINNSIFRNTE